MSLDNLVNRGVQIAKERLGFPTKTINVPTELILGGITDPYKMLALPVTDEQGIRLGLTRVVFQDEQDRWQMVTRTDLQIGRVPSPRRGITSINIPAGYRSVSKDHARIGAGGKYFDTSTNGTTFEQVQQLTSTSEMGDGNWYEYPLTQQGKITLPSGVLRTTIEASEVIRTGRKGMSVRVVDLNRKQFNVRPDDPSSFQPTYSNFFPEGQIVTMGTNGNNSIVINSSDYHLTAGVGDTHYVMLALDGKLYIKDTSTIPPFDQRQTVMG